GVTQKLVNALNARTGDDAFAAHLPEPCGEVTQEFDLDFVRWRKAGMTTFRCEGMVAEAVPVKTGDAEARSSGNHSLIPFRVFRAFAERHKIFRFESVDAVGVGFHVIDEADRW